MLTVTLNLKPLRNKKGLVLAEQKQQQQKAGRTKWVKDPCT